MRIEVIMRRCSTWLGSVFVSVVLLGAAAGAEATRLIATANRSIYDIDPTTGASSLIAGLDNTRIWVDLAGRPGDATGVYAASVVPPRSDIRNIVSRIDIDSGAVSDLYTVDPVAIGLPAGTYFEITGIAIAASSPSVATLTAVKNLTGGFTRILFDLDLDTGATSPAQDFLGSVFSWGDVTFAADGTPLAILAVSPRRFGEIDRATSQVAEIGTCGTCNIRAIEFDPDTGTLYGIDWLGSLITLSTTDATTLTTIGQTDLPATQGIAFVVPEPGTGGLLWLGLVALAMRRARLSGAHQLV